MPAFLTMFLTPESTKVPYEGIKLKWDTIGRFDIVFLAFHNYQYPYWPKF